MKDTRQSKKEEGKTGGRGLGDKREGRGKGTGKIDKDKKERKKQRKRGVETVRAQVRSGLR